MSDQTQDPTEKPESRSYGDFNNGEELDFDPHKDLNLPASYEEVLARFQKLQGDRAMESLN